MKEVCVFSETPGRGGGYLVYLSDGKLDTKSGY